MGICCMGKETQTGLCIYLEGWDGDGYGKEVLKGGDKCIPMTEIILRFYRKQQSTVKQLSFNK